MVIKKICKNTKKKKADFIPLTDIQDDIFNHMLIDIEEKRVEMVDGDGDCWTPCCYKYECEECDWKYTDTTWAAEYKSPKKVKCDECGKDLEPVFIPNVTLEYAEICLFHLRNECGNRMSLEQVIVAIDNHYMDDDIKDKLFIEKVAEIKRKYAIT